MKIFAICGSVRASSSNFSILTAAQKFLAKHEWSGIDLLSLPYFDPDLQFSDETPEVVSKMRKSAGEADLIFISTPEYAHGMPGILKNGLEWLFCEATMKKPVWVIIGSGQGDSTRLQLLDVLRTMDFTAEENQILMIRGPRSKVSADGVILDEPTRKNFEAFLSELTSSLLS